LLDQISGQQKKASQAAAKTVTIEMSGQTKRYFQLLNSAYGSGNKAHSSQWDSASSFARDAMSVVGEAAHIASFIPGLP